MLRIGDDASRSPNAGSPGDPRGAPPGRRCHLKAPLAKVRHHPPAAVEQDLREAEEDTGVVSFAGGVPADELFPAAEVERALSRSLRGEAAKVLQYGWPGGVAHLRAQIAHRMARRGVVMPCEQILITSGAQQGLSLLAQLLVPEGAPIAVEVPTYTSALQAFDLRRPVYRPVPRTARGIDLDALDAALGRGAARVLYVVPSGHNPTGGVLGNAACEAVLARAERHDAWVIDDDAYGEIQFGTPEPPLLAFGRHRDHIAHVGSFSKVLAPGLRVGWVAGPEGLIRELGRIKQAQDLETATLTQYVLSAWLEAHSLDEHIARILSVYRARRDALVDALRARLPALRWETPSAGFSLLAHLPPPLDAAELLPRGLVEGVGFEPAAPYFVGATDRGALRLSFSNVPEPDIRRGVERLARLL